MIYAAVGTLTLIGLIVQSRKALFGSFVLSALWPVLISAGAYFSVKKLVFSKHGPSEKFFELEALIIVATTGALVLFLRTTYDLSWMYAWPWKP